MEQYLIKAIFEDDTLKVEKFEFHRLRNALAIFETLRTKSWVKSVSLYDREDTSNEPLLLVMNR